MPPDSQKFLEENVGTKIFNGVFCTDLFLYLIPKAMKAKANINR